jgi:hypothetical protein
MGFDELRAAEWDSFVGFLKWILDRLFKSFEDIAAIGPFFKRCCSPIRFIRIGTRASM